MEYSSQDRAGADGFEFDAEGVLVKYFEQYNGYYTRGWATELTADAALEGFMDSGLGDIGEYDIEVDESGWKVSTQDGSYYWTIDQTGAPFAGVLSPDEGISHQDSQAWESITAATSRDA